MTLTYLPRTKEWALELASQVFYVDDKTLDTMYPNWWSQRCKARVFFMDCVWDGLIVESSHLEEFTLARCIRRGL